MNGKKFRKILFNQLPFEKSSSNVKKIEEKSFQSKYLHTINFLLTTYVKFIYIMVLKIICHLLCQHSNAS